MSEIERKWVPADWLDEVPAQTGVSPDEFLKRSPAGVLQLYPLDAEEIDGKPDSRIRPIWPGEQVEFCWTESRGEAVLTVHADGTWSCPVQFDADTTHFWLPYDFESPADSLEHLVDGEGLRPRLEAGEHQVEAYVWSDAIPFRVEVLESGAARFVGAAT